MFSYKKRFFTKRIKAIGHKWDQNSDRMDVYHLDGSITSIAEWKHYDLYLDKDWVSFTKKQMEKEARQKIDLEVDHE